MRSAERIVFTFGALGETGQSATLPKRADAFTTVGQNLMWIGLMSDIPDQPVGRRVKDVVQRHSELYNTEARAEVTASDGDGVDGFTTQFVGHLSQLTGFQAPEVLRGLDLVEQWGL